MEIPVTITAESSPPRDVVVQCDSNSTVAQLANALDVASRGFWLGATAVPESARLVDLGLTAGARLTVAAAPPAEPSRSPSPFALVVVGGLAAGATFPLPGGEVTIGRADGCDVTLRDELVSRLHAKLTVGDDGVVLEDLDSANGTTVNAAPVTAPTPVQETDLIGLGSTIVALSTIRHARAELDPAGDGRLRYNKPPRVIPMLEAPTIAMPDKPPRADRPAPSPSGRSSPRSCSARSSTSSPSSSPA